MRAAPQRPSIPALVILVISAFAIMATSEAEFSLPGNVETTVELTQAQPAMEITFTSQFAAQPRADYRIEWDRAEEVDVTTSETVGGSFDTASLAIFRSESATLVVSALDPAALTEPLAVTFTARSEHWISGQDPEDLTAPIKVDLDGGIDRPVLPLVRVRPTLNFDEIAQWRFTVSTEAALTEPRTLVASRREVSLSDNRNIRLWNQAWDLIPFPPGSSVVVVPESCFSGPCEFDIHLVLAGQSFPGLEFELLDGEGRDPSPFSVRTQEVPLLAHTAQAPWGPVEVEENETTFLNFDVGLPALDEASLSPEVYFVVWNTDPDTDDESSLSFNNDEQSLRRGTWASPGQNKISGGVSGFLRDDTEASGIVTVTLFTVDPLASGEAVSVAVSP